MLSHHLREVRRGSSVAMLPLAMSVWSLMVGFSLIFVVKVYFLLVHRRSKVDFSRTRLMMEEEKRIGSSPLFGNKTLINGEITSVTVKESTVEKVLQQRYSSAPGETKIQKQSWMSEGDRKSTTICQPRAEPPPSPSSVFTTTAVLESPPHQPERMQPLNDQEPAQGRLTEMKDIGCLTEKLPTVSVAIGTEGEVLEAVSVPKEQAVPAPIVEEPDGSPSTPDDPDALPTPPPLTQPVLVDGKKPDHNPEDSCIVDCLFYTMQCCECNLM